MFIKEYLASKTILFKILVQAFFIVECCRVPLFAEETIKLGSSTVLSMGVGEENTLSVGAYAIEGFQLYFKKINSLGGVGGRKIELLVLDDHYDPVTAGKNLKKLIHEEKVLALLGDNGTPQLAVTIPIVEKERIALYGAITGSTLLRKSPPNRYIFNFSAGNHENYLTIFKGLFSIGIKPMEIAFILQGDSGNAQYLEFLEALKDAGYDRGKDLAYGFFNYDSYNIEEAFANILRMARINQHQIKVLFVTASGISGGLIIPLSQKYFPGAILNFSYYTLRWMQIKEAVEQVNAQNIKVIVGAPVPNLHLDLPAIREYREDLKTYAPGSPEHFYMLEGYLSAKLFTVALREAAKNNKLTREGIIDALESLHQVDIGIGINISLSKDNHQALHTIWPYIFKKDQFVPLEWSELK